MPKKLKSSISGTALLKFFKTHNFILKRTKGSHMVLVRKIFLQNQILVIPNHKTIQKGTLKAIYKQATQYIAESELFNEFYSK
jgi:predicted RNA binding protein YcfA (HicA-like mRNA interferase family)